KTRNRDQAFSQEVKSPELLTRTGEQDAIKRSQSPERDKPANSGAYFHVSNNRKACDEGDQG
ncbi:MAG TPA: hypothetical protein PLF81_31475, partial [Candidatus Anammoximicrobium sp.]|nr:hypothetical protein [Candidatus Anammoximicrobium sp.]